MFVERYRKGVMLIFGPGDVGRGAEGELNHHQKGKAS
jgi:hypothetical protein